MKKVVYKEGQIKDMVKLLNGITVTGIEQARRIALIAGIIDSGEELKEEEGD